MPKLIKYLSSYARTKIQNKLGVKKVPSWIENAFRQGRVNLKTVDLIKKNNLNQLEYERIEYEAFEWATRTDVDRSVSGTDEIANAIQEQASEQGANISAETARQNALKVIQEYQLERIQKSGKGIRGTFKSGLITPTVSNKVIQLYLDRNK